LSLINISKRENYLFNSSINGIEDADLINFEKKISIKNNKL
jgi:hypothetical protein